MIINKIEFDIKVEVSVLRSGSPKLEDFYFIFSKYMTICLYWSIYIGEKTTISISTSFATNIINYGTTFIIQYSRCTLHNKPLRPQTIYNSVWASRCKYDYLIVIRMGLSWAQSCSNVWLRRVISHLEARYCSPTSPAGDSQ